MIFAFFTLPIILIIFLLCGVLGLSLTSYSWGTMPFKNYFGVLLISIVPLLNWILVLALIAVLISQILEMTDRRI